MNQIQGVSFPRSGHHLLVQMLKVHFAEKKERYPAEGMATTAAHAIVGPFSYCEYYRCCRERPCKHGATFGKSHDFCGRELEPDPDVRYIVQIREPEWAIESHYELRRGRAWKPFAAEWARSWNKFVRKWIVPNHENVLVVSYRRLVEVPSFTFAAVLDWMGVPDESQVFVAPKYRRTEITQDVAEVLAITKSLRHHGK